MNILALTYQTQFSSQIECAPEKIVRFFKNTNHVTDIGVEMIYELEVIKTEIPLNRLLRSG